MAQSPPVIAQCSIRWLNARAYLGYTRKTHYLIPEALVLRVSNKRLCLLSAVWVVLQVAALCLYRRTHTSTDLCFGGEQAGKLVCTL